MNPLVSTQPQSKEILHKESLLQKHKHTMNQEAKAKNENQSDQHQIYQGEGIKPGLAQASEKHQDDKVKKRRENENNRVNKNETKIDSIKDESNLQQFEETNSELQNDLAIDPSQSKGDHQQFVDSQKNNSPPLPPHASINPKSKNTNQVDPNLKKQNQQQQQQYLNDQVTQDNSSNKMSRNKNNENQFYQSNLQPSHPSHPSQRNTQSVPHNISHSNSQGNQLTLDQQQLNRIDSEEKNENDSKSSIQDENGLNESDQRFIQEEKDQVEQSQKFLIMTEKIEFLEKQNQILNKENSILRLKNEYITERIKEMDKQISQQIPQLQKNMNGMSHSSSLNLNTNHMNGQQFLLKGFTPRNQIETPHQTQQNLSAKSSKQDSMKNISPSSQIQQKDSIDTLSTLCQILQIDSPLNLISTVEKLNLCIQTIPKLEKFVKSIYALIPPHISIKYENYFNIPMSDVILEISSWKQQITLQNENQFAKEYLEKFYQEFCYLFEVSDFRKQDPMNILHQVSSKFQIYNSFLEVTTIHDQFQPNQALFFFKNLREKFSMNQNSRDDLVLKTALDKLNQFPQYRQFSKIILKLSGKYDLLSAQHEVKRVFEDSLKSNLPPVDPSSHYYQQRGAQNQS